MADASPPTNQELAFEEDNSTDVIPMAENSTPSIATKAPSAKQDSSEDEDDYYDSTDADFADSENSAPNMAAKYPPSNPEPIEEAENNSNNLIFMAENDTYDVAATYPPTKPEQSEDEDASTDFPDFTSGKNAPAADSTHLQPFAKEDCDDSTNVTLVVEDRKLYFSKTILCQCSPVFRAMFSDDFREKNAAEIRLPGKKYVDMVAFLKKIHPAFITDVITDETLPQILPLADEYQVESVRNDCERYIAIQAAVLEDKLTPAQVLLYLCLSDTFGFTEHRKKLLDLGSNKTAVELRQSSYFRSLLPATAQELLFGVCAKLEGRCQELQGLCGALQSHCEELEGECDKLELRCERLQGFVNGPVQKQANTLFAFARGYHPENLREQLMNMAEVLRKSPGPFG